MARSCGEIARGDARFAVVVAAGSIACDEARYVITYVLTHGRASMGAPGSPPVGWTCGWGYLSAAGEFIGRSGPSCEPRRRVAEIDLPRVDGRLVTFANDQTVRWPFPLQRAPASLDAQAFMPLIFLDDDGGVPGAGETWWA